MLNPARRTGETESEKARARLVVDAGIEVREQQSQLDLTPKSMVIDDQLGFVESLNWEPKDLTETRDYAVLTTHELETREMVYCFDADWSPQRLHAAPDSRLIWCPDNGRPAGGRLHRRRPSIRCGCRTRRYQDTVIIERLVRARPAASTFHILTKPPHSAQGREADRGASAACGYSRTWCRGAHHEAPASCTPR